MAGSISSQEVCYFIQESVIRGHHIYKHVWTPFVGEELELDQEFGNSYDHFAVVVKKNDTVVGRVPRELSRIYWNFLGNGGKITCEITGRRKGKDWKFPVYTNLKAARS